MKREFRRILLAIGVIALYLFLFPLPAGPELTINHAWALRPTLQERVGSVGDESSADRSEVPHIPFAVGSLFGYVTEQGEPLYLGISHDAVTMDRTRFALFGDRGSDVVVQSSTGDFLHRIDAPGYPHLVPAGTLVVGADGASLTSLDMEGRTIWQHTFTSTITAFDASSSLTVVGLAGGGIEAIGRDGRRLTIDAAAVGLSGVAQAVAVQGDGAGFVVVTSAETLSGAEEGLPVVLVYYEVQDGSAVPVLRREYHRQPSRRPLVAVSQDGAWLVHTLWEDGSSRVRSIDLARGGETTVVLSEPSESIVVDEANGLLWLFGRSDRPNPTLGFRYRATLDIVTEEGPTIITVPFAADSLNVRLFNELFVLTLDDRVFALSLDLQ